MRGRAVELMTESRNERLRACGVRGSSPVPVSSSLCDGGTLNRVRGRGTGVKSNTDLAGDGKAVEGAPMVRSLLPRLLGSDDADEKVGSRSDCSGSRSLFCSGSWERSGEYSCSSPLSSSGGCITTLGSGVTAGEAVLDRGKGI